MIHYRISGLLLPSEKEQNRLKSIAAKEMGVGENEILCFSIYRSSLDARRGKIGFVYSVDVSLSKKTRVRPSKKCKKIEKKAEHSIPSLPSVKDRPLVVGFGPSGMFAALLLAKAGLCPIVVERGKRVEERHRDVTAFFSGAPLLPESNVQFGEGGAGTFSDGKLNTLLGDKNFRGRFVLKTLVEAGAPQEILYQNKPHIGTDRLRIAVRNIRLMIEGLGGQIYFESRFISPVTENGKISGAKISFPDGERILPCTALFLGIGHSARDTFRALRDAGVKMEKKIFSVGVRIEHLQEKINRTQYGDRAPDLPPADYKLAVPTSTGKRLYTFCMCPGGVVVPAASEEGGVATNGMSNLARDEVNANAALLWNVLPEEVGEDLFSGFLYQRKLEERAYLLGGGDYKAPCQLVGDLLSRKRGTDFGSVIPSYARGVEKVDLAEVFSPQDICTLSEGIAKMGQILPGFDDFDAVLSGVESRATCPVWIMRDERYQANFAGLYPIGEGAGWAGGIMSSAMDGMRAAEAYFALLEDLK